MTTGHPWKPFLSESDREVVRLGGYGQPRGLGRRPALIIIDAQYNYFGKHRNTGQEYFRCCFLAHS
jgi:maleamate amidohydrolase